MKRATTEHCCSLYILRPRDTSASYSQDKGETLKVFLLTKGWLIFMAAEGSPKCILSKCVKLLLHCLLCVFWMLISHGHLQC